MKKLLYIIPIIVVFALMGGLIGSLFANAAMGALIGGLVPVVWAVVMFFGMLILFGSVSQFLDNAK